LKFSISTSILLFAGMIVAAIALIPKEALALTYWGGSFFVEDTVASSADASTNLFQTGVNLDIQPPMKKNLNTRFNVRLDYTNADGEALWNISPIGNLGVDMLGEAYTLNLQHVRTASVTSVAELVESNSSRFSLLLFPDFWPRMTLNYSTQETNVGGRNSTSDNLSLFGDYTFRWLNTRAGYIWNTIDSGSGASTSNSFFFGLGGNYEILRRTVLTGDIDINRYGSETTLGNETTTVTKAFRLGLNSRPIEWFGLGGNFSWDSSDSDMDTGNLTTVSRYADVTGTLYPLFGLRLWATAGNRTFDDVAGRRAIDFVTVGTGWDRRLNDEITLGVLLSRTSESDPEQGDNTRDNLGVNSTMDLTPRTSLRMSLNVSRNEFPTFVSTEGFAASGPLADRVLYDDQLVGFTFFDTENNDLYTKNNSGLPAEWSAPVRIDPPSNERFSTSKSVQLNMRPTDNTSAVLFYTVNNSSDTLDLLGVGSQSLNGSFVWQPNRRTSYGLTGTLSVPERGDTSNAGTVSLSYRFWHRHIMNLSYGRRKTGGESSDNVSGALRLALRKRSSLDLTYSASQLFQEEQADFSRISFTHAF
jgi:hypothetical protein